MKLGWIQILCYARIIFTIIISTVKFRPVNWDGPDLEEFLEYLPDASGGCLKQNISELHDLTRTQHIGRKSGPLGGPNFEASNVWRSQMPETQIKIGKIRESMAEFVRR